MDDEDEVGLEGRVIAGITRFEEGMDGESAAWLGGARGFAYAVAAIVGAAAVTVVTFVVSFLIPLRLVQLVLGFAWLSTLTATVAFWRRQRLAAHFEHAKRLVGSADPAERERGMTDLIMNARRGRAEHRRIAGLLSAYLRRPPYDQPNEKGRRQVALAILSDQTLSLVAKQRLDLTGASLVGLKAVNAELPGVNLHGAALTGAKFVRANLANAVLYEARTDGADFTGAILDGTVLAAQAAPRR